MRESNSLVINGKKINYKKAKKEKTPIHAIIIGIILTLYSLSMFGVLLYGFANSLKSIDNFMQDMIGLPAGNIFQWEWVNYIKTFDLLKTPIIVNGKPKTIYIETMFLNSILFAGIGSFISIATSWLIAYITSQYKCKASKIIYAGNLVLMLVPIVGALPSAMRLYINLGIYDTWWYLILTNINFIGTNYMIFHAFFSTVSTEVKEAAMIDGAGNWRIMLLIVFPMTSKMFFVLLLQWFIGRWNDYMTMIIWLPSKPTIAYGMYKFSTSTNSQGNWPPMQLTGAIELMIPVLILFLIFRNKIIGGVTIGQLK